MSTSKRNEDHRAELEHLQAAASHLREQLDEIQRSMARGTRDDLGTEAAGAVKRVGDQTGVIGHQPSLIERVEVALRARSMPLDELVRELDAPAGRVQTALRQVRDRVRNVGSEDRPRWTWVPGDEIATPDLYALVERLLREQPMYHEELRAAIGARPNRINGVLVRLQKDGKRVKNLGSKNRARWFIIPDDEVTPRAARARAAGRR